MPRAFLRNGRSRWLDRSSLSMVSSRLRQTRSPAIRFRPSFSATSPTPEYPRQLRAAHIEGLVTAGSSSRRWHGRRQHLRGREVESRSVHPRGQEQSVASEVPTIDDQRRGGALADHDALRLQPVEVRRFLGACGDCRMGCARNPPPIAMPVAGIDRLYRADGDERYGRGIIRRHRGDSRWVYRRGPETPRSAFPPAR